MKKLFYIAISLSVIFFFSTTTLAEEEGEPTTYFTIFGEIEPNIMSKVLLASISMTTPSLTLLINSFGSDTDSAMSFYSSVKKTKPNIITVGLGSISSAAVLLFCSAEKRIISRRAYIILHPIKTNFEGITLDVAKKMNDFLTKNYSKAISETTNGKLTPKKIVEMMKENTLLTGEQAVSLGIATELLEK